MLEFFVQREGVCDMARLWIKHNSDIGGLSGHRASEEAVVVVRWGATQNSKLAIKATVLWKKGDPKPLVEVTFGDDVLS